MIELPENLLSDPTADPHPALHDLRAADPVHWSERYRSWIVTRHDDVAAGFRDPRLSADRISPFLDHLPAPERERLEPVFGVLANWMVFRDPPDHTRLRRLVSKAFTARAVQALREGIEHTVDTLVEQIPDGEATDIISELAAPLPAIVIARMLGVPPEDRDSFIGWSDDIVSLVFGAADVADRHDRAQRGMIELTEYLKTLIVHYRTHPADNVLSALVKAEEERDNLSTDELVATCTLLLFGGHETTTNLIGNGIHAFLRHPDQWKVMRAEPSLVPSAVEEILRYDGPGKVAVRTVLAGHELRGRRLRAGDRVFLVVAAANRDPERFPDPDRFDIRRSDNGHLGFGLGIHFCLGAPLARLEGAAALRAVCRRFSELAPATDELRWHTTILSRGLVSLPVVPSNGVVKVGTATP